MEISNVADLVGPAALVTLEDASVLRGRSPLVLVEPGSLHEEEAEAAGATLRAAATVTVLVGRPGETDDRWVDAVDVCLTDAVDPPRPWVRGDRGAIDDAVDAHAEAALALVALLRTSASLDVRSAVAAEAATYAALMGSEDHRGWIAGRGPASPAPTDGPSVTTDRDAGLLTVTLDRPASRNAVDRPLRDELVDALALALVDDTVEAVDLRGAGLDFCAGGDLREFGTTTDPATALAVRLTRHPGWSAHLVADRLTAHLHGHCIGAGIEIPAFAGRVVADPGTRIRLPELDLGLVPGAGGTVSLTRRIGRHRTNWLALTGAEIDARTALDWGLVDEIVAR